jgi:hypothetical protein
MPTTYREIPTKLAAGEPFQGGSMSAHRHGNVYVVMSYGTTIAERFEDDGAVIYNARSFSKTTSRHQHLVRTYLPATTWTGVDAPRGTTDLQRYVAARRA